MRKILLSLLLLCALATSILLIYHQQPEAVSSGTCIDIPASPDYLSSNSETDAIAAINNAHKQEKLSPLRLPTNYYHLGPVQQQFILLNLERTDRGLQPLKMDAALSQVALAYSRQLSNLHFFSHTSPISGTFTDRVNSNPATAKHYSAAAENLAGNPVAGAGPMYEYMYDDSVEDCGHRLNILDPGLTLVGINWVRGSQYGSISAQEFLTSAPWNPYSPPPPDTLAPYVFIAGQPILKNSILSCRALAGDNLGVVRITWFLDQFGNQPYIGTTRALAVGHLSPGKHTLLVYVVDGALNYSMTSCTFIL
ncbi:MAG TPA: CAP domain-containing protein [Ktedonobacteraceae bacterium]|nr:CAP domain-containing protein [Ktedonobacteraceae bacterium]